MTTPQVGQTAIVLNIFSNGLNEHPAILTRVWCYDELKAEGCVNLTMFPDAGTPCIHTSVPFFPDRRSALDHLATQGSYSAMKIVCYAKD